MSRALAEVVRVTSPCITRSWSGQHFGFGLYFIPHNAGNFIGLVLGGVLLAAAQQKQNQQHIGQYRQQQKNNQ